MKRAVFLTFALVAGCGGGVPDLLNVPRDGAPPIADAAPPVVSPPVPAIDAAVAPVPPDGAPATDTSSAPAPDAAVAADDASGEPPLTPPDAYACTLVLGIKETGEWFDAGFEDIVENARWEVVPIHNGALELWADPANGMWSLPPQSPCARGATAPDRIIFCGANYDYSTTDEFVPRYRAVIDNIKVRYPTVKRVDLITLVRAPGNQPCPGNLTEKTWIRPAQDESISLMTRAYPGFVYASPRFEVRSCADFAMPPHFTSAAAMAAAKTIGAYYRVH
jgi:hypothetical protein